ncbi:Protein max [Chelonia mydas]|uniref:Protein max n=1 Tax=Chelonia mydas TaxID=8469 RepID=M7ASN8_CHEMY|nr:Protein max [Chelonia mydas]
MAEPDAAFTLLLPGLRARCSRTAIIHGVDDAVCWAIPMSRLLQADKRAHHNALERKRRDHIKDSFHSLRDSVPSLQGEKASRAQILDKATEYIQYMRRKNHTHQQDIDDLKRQNALLEQQGSAMGEGWACIGQAGGQQLGLI